MTDIVEELRRKHEMWALGQKGPQILLDAADEIERLRLEHRYACQEISVAIAERDAARAEIERLRTAPVTDARREETARIIDPDAIDQCNHDSNFLFRANDARKKADAILALLSGAGNGRE